MGMGYDRMAGYERLGYPGTGNTPSPTFRWPPHCCLDPSSLLLGLLHTVSNSAPRLPL